MNGPTAVEGMLLRTAAGATAAGTIAFLVIGGHWRGSNPFLVPDLLASGGLAAGALSPRRMMRPLLQTSFPIGVGVFSAASATDLVQGRVGVGATAAFVTCLIAAGWLLREAVRTSGR